MATEVSKQQAAKIRAQAEAADKRCRSLVNSLVAGPWDVAFVAADIRKKEFWKYLKTTYDSMNTWAQEVFGTGRSTYFNYIRLWGEFESHVPKKIVRQFPLANASWLAKLPPDQRKDEAMWQKAITMKAEDFAEIVKKKQKANGQTVSDMRKPLSKIRCYEDQYDFIMGGLEQIADHYKDDIPPGDLGRALEFCIAETLQSIDDTYNERVKNTFTKAAFHLAQTKSLKDTLLSADEIVEKQAEAIALAINELAEGSKGLALRAAKDLDKKQSRKLKKAAEAPPPVDLKKAEVASAATQ